MSALLEHPYRLPLRSGLLQTFLASSPWRAWGPNPMQAEAIAEVIATAGGVRLLGVRSRQTAALKGLAILLHGWEGSADSTYMRCRLRPIINLRHVAAVSPVLDPEESTRRADRHPVIRHYFMRKWRRSLDLKQRLFPDLYDFSAAATKTTCRTCSTAWRKRRFRAMAECGRLACFSGDPCLI